MLQNQSLLNKYKIFTEKPSEEDCDKVLTYFKGHQITKEMNWLVKVISNFNGLYIQEESEESMANFEIMGNLLKDFEKTAVHNFRIEDELIGLLMKTNSRIEYCHFPFTACFIDGEIKINKKTSLYGLFLVDIPNIKKEKIKASNFIIGMIKFKKSRTNYYSFFPYVEIIMKEKTFDHSKLIKNVGFDIYKDVNNFVFSFLNFLNTKDIELIENVYSEEAKEKMRKKGKIIRHSDNIIRVTGKLKIYLESLRERFGGAIDFSHRFWCRGHFMNLRSDRYIHKQGMKVWRLPHIKGKGILKQKEYLLKIEKPKTLNKSKID